MIFSILPAITLYSWEVSFVLNGKFSQKIHKHKSFRAKYAWSFYISPHVLARCAICSRYKYFSTLFMYFIIIYCRICGRIEFWTQPLSTSLPWVVLVFPLYENFRRACLSIWPNPSVRVTFLNNSLLRRRSLKKETENPAEERNENPGTFFSPSSQTGEDLILAITCGYVPQLKPTQTIPACVPQKTSQPYVCAVENLPALRVCRRKPPSPTCVP